MQPISALSNTMIAPRWAISVQPGVAAGGSFQDIWHAALRHADTLAAEAHDARQAPTASMTKVANAQAALDAASQLCDRVLSAFNEIKDIRI